MKARGLTLIELLVVLVILSILASAALPYAEVTIRRDKELELKRSLREIRTAIDRFHEDWLSGKISEDSSDASSDGYPKTLDVLVEGVDTLGVNATRRYYLRRIPLDPFQDAQTPSDEQWHLRSYKDDTDAYSWGGEDVYDVRTQSERQALNNTYYRDW